MSHKKNNRIFVILIIIICIILIIAGIYKTIENKNTLGQESNNGSLPQPAPLEVQSLIELQRDKGPSAILDIDCLSEPTTDAKKYCLDSQNILKQIYSK